MTGVAGDLELVDHHCHGVLRERLDRHAFEASLTEADGPGPLHPNLFDSQTGMAVRALCAPLLDLPRHAVPEDYLARRSELGAEEVNRRLLAVTGISHYLCDTGFLPDRLTSPGELAAYTGAAAAEIIRLETVAEAVVTSSDPENFADRFRKEIEQRAGDAVGFKSVAAYRGGLDLDPARPTPAEVTRAAETWARAIEADGRVRLADRTLIRFGIWTALDLGKPLQFHVGYGDADVDLRTCDPLHLTPLLRATAGAGVPITLLHNYPFHRNAAFLAQVFDHVFVDVGLALHNVGSRASAVLAELLELAPFSAVLFSSDAAALAELYTIDTALFRRALSTFLDQGMAAEFWSATDAERIARMICSENARRAYRLVDA